ncbi:MAG TPA: DUF2142 domain-containing protein [Anaerolineaceae bacterium]|nr:DUF2142 domain-containing protein [Anaerolineaceae bacterium]
MLVILPAVAFLGVFLLLIGYRDPDQPGVLRGREAFLESLVLGYAYLALSTELLGWLHAITFWGIVGCWALALGILAGLGIRGGLFSSAVQKVRAAWQRRLKDSAGLEWGGVFLVGVFAALLAVIAFLSPPNTNDSLTYHMSRVMNWIQNQSVAHYPTVELRQLWNPPGVEYAILHLVILAGSDRFAPFVQWASFFSCLAAVSLIAERLGAGREGRWLAVFFCLTLPMAIIQATSTQNDLTTALWALACIYWVLVGVQRPLTRYEWIVFGLAAGLGALAKGTFYAYAIPFFTWLFISSVRKVGLKQAAAAALGSGLIVCLLNAGIWSRNISAYGSPLGDPGSVGYLANQELTPTGVVSNLTRNAGMEMVTPFEALNRPVLDTIGWIHTQMGQDLNDPRTSLRDFSVHFTITSEDYGINPLHMWMILGLWLASAVIWAVWRFRKGAFESICGEALLYSGLVFVTLLLFSGLYKWQPWGGRLLLPFFGAAAPLFGVFVSKIPYRGIRAILIGALVLTSLAPLLANTARPLVKVNGRYFSVLDSSRQDLLFINSPELKTGYTELARWVRVTRCDRLGLVIASGENEYPLWALLAPSGTERRIAHLDPFHPLAEEGTRLGVGTKEFHPCAVFVNDPDFDPQTLPGFALAESRLDLKLFVLRELMPLIR